MKFWKTLLAVLLMSCAGCWAQTVGVSAKSLLRTALSGDETKETLILAIEFAPGATTGRHVHPGDEYAVVLEGLLELRVEGQAFRRVASGQAYHNARGVIHETVNVGEGPARSVATFVVDKGKPVTVAAP